MPAGSRPIRIRADKALRDELIREVYLDGISQEAIAKGLHVSRRTVQNALAELIARPKPPSRELVIQPAHAYHHYYGEAADSVAWNRTLAEKDDERFVRYRIGWLPPRPGPWRLGYPHVCHVATHFGTFKLLDEARKVDAQEREARGEAFLPRPIEPWRRAAAEVALLQRDCLRTPCRGPGWDREWFLDIVEEVERELAEDGHHIDRSRWKRAPGLGGELDGGAHTLGRGRSPARPRRPGPLGRSSMPGRIAR